MAAGLQENPLTRLEILETEGKKCHHGPHALKLHISIDNFYILTQGLD